MFTPEKLAAMLVTFIVTIVNLLIMYWVLKRFLFKPIMLVLAKRQNQIEQDLAQAKADREQSHLELKKAKQKAEQAVSDAARIVHDARVQAQSESHSLIQDAQSQARDVLERAESQREHMRQALLHDVRGEITDLAVSIASQVIQSQMSTQEQRSMVDEILTERLAQGETQQGSVVAASQSVQEALEQRVGEAEHEA